MTKVTVPDETTRAAVQQMLATIQAQWAQFEVQQITNGQTGSAVCAANGQTYDQKFEELAAAEGRLRDKYSELLG